MPAQILHSYVPTLPENTLTAKKLYCMCLTTVRVLTITSSVHSFTQCVVCRPGCNEQNTAIRNFTTGRLLIARQPTQWSSLKKQQLYVHACVRTCVCVREVEIEKELTDREVQIQTKDDVGKHQRRVLDNVVVTSVMNVSHVRAR